MRKVWIIIAGLIIVASIGHAQELTRDERAQAITEYDTAVEKMNESNAWAEYLKTGKTKIPLAVKRKIGKEFTRGKGFRIIKGEKVQVRTSARQRRAVKLQGGRR